MLDGKINPDRFADHIVLIGTSAAGVINDQRATPIGPDIPGVEIHAQLLDQILEGPFPGAAGLGGRRRVVFAFILGVALIACFPSIGAFWSAVLGAAAVGIAFAVSWFAFTRAQWLIDPIYPWAVLTAVYLVASLIGHLRTEARRRDPRRLLALHVAPLCRRARRPPGKARARRRDQNDDAHVLRHPRLHNAGRRAWTRTHSTHFINTFLTPMTEIITEHKGTIDKYIGDCIMAFWNAPLDDPDHARNAVRAVQAMRAKLVELNRGWEAEARAAGKTFDPVRMGIGLNSGECCVGNFGSQQHFDYSLLGDPVNLASRLEGLGKLYGVDLVIGEQTAELLDDPALIEIDLVAVKGKLRAEPHLHLAVRTLPSEGSADALICEPHSALLKAYRQRDWSAALRLLDDAQLVAARYLAPIYDLYRRQIAEFQRTAPPPDWNGVFLADEK